MSNDFDMFDLHPQVLQAVTDLGYEVPTPIQERAIPALLAGRDVLGQAQTGTGKTAAFALPLLHRLEADAHGVQGLILTPTRELALQVSKAIYEYGRLRGVRVLAIYGGQSYDRQISRLERGVDVVVGTPGRMLDLIHRGVLDLSAVRYLVLDEADEMLSMGFIEDIEAILEDEFAQVEETWKLDSIQISSGTHSIPTATVRLLDAKGVIHEDAATGDGPVDALYKTLERMTGVHAKLNDYRIRAVTMGKDAQGEVAVEVEVKGHRVTTRGVSTDIIQASALAYLKAINAAIAREKRCGQKTKTRKA